MTGLPSLYLAVTGAILGAAFGSYAGVVRARGWRGSLRGRSRCEACDRQLPWYELVPVISFLSLSGRCRACHSPIGPGPLVVELAGAGLGILVGVMLGR